MPMSMLHVSSGVQGPFATSARRVGCACYVWPGTASGRRYPAGASSVAASRPVPCLTRNYLRLALAVAAVVAAPVGGFAGQLKLERARMPSGGAARLQKVLALEGRGRRQQDADLARSLVPQPAPPGREALRDALQRRAPRGLRSDSRPWPLQAGGGGMQTRGPPTSPPAPLDAGAGPGRVARSSARQTSALP